MKGSNVTVSPFVVQVSYLRNTYIHNVIHTQIHTYIHTYIHTVPWRRPTRTAASCWSRMRTHCRSYRHTSARAVTLTQPATPDSSIHTDSKTERFIWFSYTLTIIGLYLLTLYMLYVCTQSVCMFVCMYVGMYVCMIFLHTNMFYLGSWPNPTTRARCDRLQIKEHQRTYKCEFVSY